MPDDPAPHRRGSAHRWVLALAPVLIGACALAAVASLRRADRWPGPVRTASAVGDSTCLSCHREKATFEGTAHHLTSAYPTRASIRGTFRQGGNVLRTANPQVHFRMDADSTGFRQTAVVGRAPDTSSRSERIALVVGSGRKGQSYLYRVGDRLYQLPISYWTSIGWINSPGPAYVDGRPNFERAVAPRCLECHATWIEAIPDLRFANRYETEGAIVGITCERCHAAGREHVMRERSVLHALRRPAIVNPVRLDRERQMEACGQCHGGLGAPKMPSFSYVAGRRLDDYLELTTAPDAGVDVHGNQVALLSRSSCYRASQMTCLTCHDVHRQQRDVADLSARCLGCHQEQRCPVVARQGHALARRCVDCHMPLQASSLIVSDLEGKPERAMIRTHWIRVYRDTIRPATVRADGSDTGRATSPLDRRAPAPRAEAPR